MSQIRLQNLARGKGPLSAKQILQIRKWLQDDWESHDQDRSLVRVIERLVDTVQARPTGTVEFKIRDKKTGLYSSGGYVPSWSESGKSWKSLAGIRAHLRMTGRGSRYHLATKVSPTWEVVEFHLERIGRVRSALSLLKA